MPLTAYSASREMELDVDQLLTHLAHQSQHPQLPSNVAIPDAWKLAIAQDISCPSCFCQGAEVVRGTAAGAKNKRQAFFRFTTGGGNPGHHPFCDFSGNVPAGHVPENLVQFTNPKDGLSKAVRVLVCKGISLGTFHQRDIRAMREWFFHKKVGSQFVVSLDPRIVRWIAVLQRQRLWIHDGVDEALDFTPELMALPVFDAKHAARVILTNQHRALLDLLFENRIHVFQDVERITKSVEQSQAQSVFDPSILQTEFRKTLQLARFIGTSYLPISTHVKSHSWVHTPKGGRFMLAFTSLLLFVSDWDMKRAWEAFVRIAKDDSVVDETLGNAIGLNPFHDFEVWPIIKFLQELPSDLLPTEKEMLEQPTTLDGLVASLRQGG
ncbi:hypothetical protein PPUJ20066_11710 [Pseudomonas putida]|nr:hypothetical protein PPUJ20066_11710 [Pseudomonas putida]